MKTFFSSGDIGDLIYCLPIIKHHGPGEFVVGNRPVTKRITYFEHIKPLMDLQPYVTDFRWERNGERFTHDMSTFRPPSRLCSLTEITAESVGLWPVNVADSWIFGFPITRGDYITVNLSERWPSSEFPWGKVAEYYSKKIRFIGTDREHELFCELYGHVDKSDVVTFRDIAEEIAGAFLHIGNQSSPYAVAEGLKKDRILAVCQYTPDCLLHPHENSQHIYDGCGVFPHPDKEPLVISPPQKRLRDRMNGYPGGYRFHKGLHTFIASNWNALMAKIRREFPDIEEDEVDAQLAESQKPPITTGVDPSQFPRVTKRLREVGYNEEKIHSYFASLRR